MKTLAEIIDELKCLQEIQNTLSVRALREQLLQVGHDLQKLTDRLIL